MTVEQLDVYQYHVMRTANPGLDFEARLLNAALGLTGEGGEFADMVKKGVFHGHDLDRTKAVKELGDILFYVAWAADTLGTSLSEVATMNVDKLRRRYPNGFSTGDSIARVDTYATEEEESMVGGTD